MSDEVASAALSSSQKAIEVALELIRMLAPMAKKLLEEVYQKTVGGVNAVGGKIANARTAGTVTNKGLIVLWGQLLPAADKLTFNAVFLKKRFHRGYVILAYYKAFYGLRSVFQSLLHYFRCYLLDNAFIAFKIFKRLLFAVTDYRHGYFVFLGFRRDQFRVTRKKISCSEDGKISCIYPAECAEQVAVIKNDYKEIHANVEANFGITPNVPETERQLEIMAQIAELQNARENPELRDNINALCAVVQSITLFLPKRFSRNLCRGGHL